MIYPGIMKHLAVALLLICASVLLHSCRTILPPALPVSQSHSHETASALETDSQNGFVRMPDSRVRVKSIHDSDSIELEIRTADTLTLRSLLINGVSVWFDPKAERNTSFGISFPAARSEMMRRQEQIIREHEEQRRQRMEQGDTIPRPIPFNPRMWVEAMQDRQPVVKDQEGTRFAERENAQIFLDKNGELVYKVRFAFSQMGVSGEDQKRISIGIVSELHRAQLASPGGGGVATRPDISDRDRRQQPRTTQPQQRPVRMNLIPVNTWMAFLINEEMPENQDEAESKREMRDNDDVYR